MKILFIIITLLSTSTFANAESDKRKFSSGLTQRYIKLLCDADYLICINKNKSECISSVVSATSNCPMDDFYKTTIPSNKDENIQLKEMGKESELFGNCVTGKFLKKINITEKIFEGCAMALPTLKSAK